MKILFITLVVTLVGCSPLETYKTPESKKLSKLKLPTSNEYTLMVGELGSNQCVSKMSKVSDSSFIDSENIHIEADKYIVLNYYHNKNSNCGNEFAFFAEENNKYETRFITSPVFCGLEITDVTDRKMVERIKLERLKKRCLVN